MLYDVITQMVHFTFSLQVVHWQEQNTIHLNFFVKSAPTKHQQEGAQSLEGTNKNFWKTHLAIWDVQHFQVWTVDTHFLEKEREWQPTKLPLFSLEVLPWPKKNGHLDYA